MVAVSQRVWQLGRSWGQRTSLWPHPWIQRILAGLLIWLAVLGIVLAQPAIDPAFLRGAFVGDTPDAPFRWTSSQVTIPIAARSGPTSFDLVLAAGLWPGRAPVDARLTAPGLPALVLPLIDRPRHYMLLLPAQADTAVLDVRADPGPAGDRRYLGVRLYAVAAHPSGVPWNALGWASAALVLALVVAGLLNWCAARGWLLIGITTLIGLGLRVWALDRLPPGFFQDEAVSAVDAWSLLQTGRDHLGHVLPLGAFESFGDWVSPLLTYTQLPFIALFGPGPLGARISAALAGTLAIPAAYAVARELRCERPAAGLVGLVVACSPWQILRSRVASPPALVPLCWLLVLWAGLRLIRLGRRQDALWLALAAGLGLYSYPTMKLVVPLLAAGAVGLALWAGSTGSTGAGVGLNARFRAIGLMLANWWWAGVALVLLWLPFAQLTLFNLNSAMRASRKILRAASLIEWLAQWSDGYSSYLRPDLYFLAGDPSNGASQGVQLTLEAPLLLLGVVMLIWCAIGWRRAAVHVPVQYRLVVLAALLAPLPASLMAPNPQLTRALIIAPIYALVVGFGAQLILNRLVHVVRWGLGGPTLLAVLALGIGVQGALRYNDYRTEFPILMERKYQDGTREAFERLVTLAPGYDEIWVDDRLPFPYIYVLAAGGVPAAEAQATIVVDRPGTTFNTVRSVGRYRFTDLKPIPTGLPALAATVTSLGNPGFVIQEWHASGKRVLLLRRMA